MALFENYDRRIAKINGVIKEYGISSVGASSPSASRTCAGPTAWAPPSP